jgi:hypothetical protein
LADLADGRSESGKAEALRAHIASGCESCGERMAQIERLRGVMQRGELTSAPASVVARAKELFRERFKKPARRSLLAILLSDSRSQLALAGARGGESGQIQALYGTDEHDIDLWQERMEDGRWYVIGQILPKAGGAPIEAESAQLLGSAGSFEGTREDSEFHLSGVPAGEYSLRILLTNSEITADRLQIGA